MSSQLHRRLRAGLALSSGLTATLASAAAHASLFHGETLDAVANGISWVVLVIVPIVGIVVFWLVHILPEKVAEQRRHPQAQAIQTLCILSLFFGGLLWPLAWLWAYSKPVLYRLAYGTDVSDEGHGEPARPEPTAVEPGTVNEEMTRLRERLAHLEAQAAQEARG